VELLDSFDLGRMVVCDSCNTELTDDPRCGGILFGTRAIGPCCAPSWLVAAAENDELDDIKGYCPEGTSFADWVRDVIRGGRPASIQIYGGPVSP